MWRNGSGRCLDFAGGRGGVARRLHEVRSKPPPYVPAIFTAVFFPHKGANSLLTSSSLCTVRTISRASSRFSGVRCAERGSISTLRLSRPLSPSSSFSAFRGVNRDPQHALFASFIRYRLVPRRIARIHVCSFARQLRGLRVVTGSNSMQ